MSWTAWIIVFLIFNLIHFLGTWNLYERAGRKKWEAAIPIYNAIVLFGIIRRPKWWVILMFIPIVNLFIFPVIWVETCRSFRYDELRHTLYAIVSLGFYIYYINYATNTPYLENRNLESTTFVGDFINSIVFAVVAATLVHTYVIQPYTIPTSSLEQTLLVGDFLFVSKFHYGARTPITALSAPMVHDSLAGVKSYVSNSKNEKSWLNKLSFPYFRLPGTQGIKRNDIVVFSWPADTTNYMWGDNSGKYTYKPIDKKTNYVKRCVGIPGDSLEVRNGYVYINGKRSQLPPNAKPQWNHIIYSKSEPDAKMISKYSREFETSFKVVVTSQEQLNLILQSSRKVQRVADNEFLAMTEERQAFINFCEAYKIPYTEVKTKFKIANLTDADAQKLREEPTIDSVVKQIKPAVKFDKSIFPHNINYVWNNDNFGPIYIPRKGDKVVINKATIPFYEQIIRRFEHNDLTILDDKIYINGKLATDYTFKKDYYWMMGDNRHRSLDARSWGYTPFDHVVGKPIMVWFSWDSKTGSPRWNRMFTTIPTEGEPKSYFWIGIICVIIILVIVFKPSKKKNNREMKTRF